MKIAIGLAAAVAVLWAAPSLAGPPVPEDQTEIALRALLTVVDETIKPEAQHCNLGGVYIKSYLDSHPDKGDIVEGVTVGEALLGELAQMVDGRNGVKGRCRGAIHAHCEVELWHQRGEAASNTVFRFETVDGKARIDSLQCISTP